MIRRRWSKITYFLKFYIICVGLCQDQCLRKCWKGMPGTQVDGGLQVPNVTSENDCKALCANNGTCVGIDWDGNCWFQMTPFSKYSPKGGVYHWDLVDCSDDCLSYCWKPLKNNSGIFGADFRESKDENHCKLLCSRTTDCTGVDWNIEGNSCWLTDFIGTISNNRPSIHHWDIVRNTSTNCQLNSSVTNPSYPPSVTISTASTTSARKSSALDQDSTSPLSYVPNPTVNSSVTNSSYPPPVTDSTASTTSARKSSALDQVSTSPLSDVPNPTGRDATNVNGLFQIGRDTKDSEESLKAAVIALAVLSGVFLVVIVVLAVVLFRTTRLQRGQSSRSNVQEQDKPYDSLQLDTRSQDPVYTDLQPTN